jgi:hypothetical protein
MSDAASIRLCPAGRATEMARQLVQCGSVINDAGHRIRRVLFASLAPLKKSDRKLAPISARENPHDDQTHHGHRADSGAETA